MAEALKPCPFCGQTTGYDPSDEDCDFICSHCGMITLFVGTPEETRAKWNRRASDEHTDTLDLMRDEFLRIIAVMKGEKSPYHDEVIGMCERAIAKIHQHVPVIVQRDIAERDRDVLLCLIYNAEEHIPAEFLTDPRLEAIKRKNPNVIPYRYLEETESPTPPMTREEQTHEP